MASTILVVEDEPLLRLTVCEELEERGFKVLEAEDAEQAFRILRGTSDIDLVFTDIRLPGNHDGWDVAIEARRHYPSMPIVYTTGYAPDPERKVPEGEMLRKPYPLANLFDLLGRLGVNGK
jgi:CheY-like chemotaxis protein